MSESRSVIVTPADMALAAQYANKPAAIAPEIDAIDLANAASNQTRRVTIGNGAFIDVSHNESPRSFIVGGGDPAQAVIDTEIEGMARRAEFLQEQMHTMLDRETGEPLPHLVPEYNKLSLQLQSLQYSAAFQQHHAVRAIRAKVSESKARGLEQLQREAAAQDQRAQDETAREFDRLFGRTTIR